MRSRRPWKHGVAGTLVVLALSAGCGGDDGDDADDAASAPTDAGSSTEDTDNTGDDTGTGSRFDCPLSAEQVGEILGASVERNEGTCSYSPGGNAGSLPTAGFLEQLVELCDGDFLTQSGFTEPVEGLGVDAYLKPDSPFDAELWVCADAAFVVAVGMEYSDTDAAAVAAAEALAFAALEAG